MDSKLLRCLLPIIRNGLRRGVGIEDLEGCGGYEQVQDALFWMEDKGLIKAQSTGVLGSYGDIYQATITTLGQDFMDNDYSFPLTKIEVTLNEKQLEALLLG